MAYTPNSELQKLFTTYTSDANSIGMHLTRLLQRAEPTIRFWCRPAPM